MSSSRTNQLQNTKNIVINELIRDPYDPSNPINQVKPTEMNDPYVLTNKVIEENEENEETNTQVETNKFTISPELEAKLAKCNIKDVPEFSLNGIRTIGKVVDVYDGDTCKIILANSNVLMRFNCRLKFLDTPEMKPLRNKPNRDVEIVNAMRCRNKLIQLVTNCQLSLDDKLTKVQVKKLLNSNDKVIQVQCHEFDKYGRLLVELYLGDKTVNTTLVEEGFAKSYNGGTKDVFVY
jgi:endonuclease YncB( thermonuclease family)